MLAALLIVLGLILIAAAMGDAPAPEPDITVTHYTGPRYSPWGNEIGPEVRSCA